MNGTTDSNKPDKALESKVAPAGPSAHLPISISPETLNGLLAVSESLQRYMQQNNRIFDQIAKASAACASIPDMVNLSASLRVSEMAAAQVRSIELINGAVLQSPVLKHANAVNLSVGRLFEATGATRVNDLLSQVARSSSMWEEQVQAIAKAVGQSQRYDLALQSHLADISRFTVLSQAAVSRLAWANLGNALDLQASVRSTLQSRVLDITQSYSNLFDFWERQPSSIASLPPVISRYPAIDYFNGVDVVDSITLAPYKDDIEFQREKQQAEAQLQAEVGDRLEMLLGRLNAELVIPLRGARQSVGSTNPDHVRHFATSQRELFTHVLHALSPDDRVRAWSTVPQHYDKGNPTRRARLLYVCRSVNQEQFSTFVEKDIDAALEFLGLFQRGTHEVVPKYTEMQLRIMLLRMEYLLRYLLEIGSADL